VQDVCQDVFVKLCLDECRLLKGYDSSKAKFSTWITVVSRNVAVDFLRKNNKKSVSIEDVCESKHSYLCDGLHKIDVPKNTLSSRQMLVLKMMYNDGQDVESIARVLSVKPQTVRSLHHRAVSNLRNFYGVATSAVKAAATTEKG